MANDGWFRCDKCKDEKKVYVSDWVTTLQDKHENCGGTYRKTDDHIIRRW